ncbi:unnamed protein product [Somion occarium]|uniref:Uncharacterized protein n=1 Tax=Somion occarium TaxID=3059160 RepID=A0ABP1DU74_9APHY
MYSHTLAVIAITILSCSFALVSSSPIDEVNANILAMKNNLGCTSPNGCQRNATIDDAVTSGVLAAIPPRTAPVVVAALAGGLVASLL